MLAHDSYARRRHPVAAAYNQWAAQYDLDRNPTRVTLTRWCCHGRGARPLATAQALETGCGTGKNTTFLAGISQRLLAVVFSPGMLAVCHRSNPAVQLQLAQWDCCNRGQSRMPVWIWSPAVWCWSTLTTCPYFAEGARVLAPGAHLWVCELHPTSSTTAVRPALPLPQANTVKVAAFTHHISDFTSTAAAFNFATRRTQRVVAR